MSNNCTICNKNIGYSGNEGTHSSTFKAPVCYNCLENPKVNEKLVIPNVTELENDVIMKGIVESDFFDDCTNGMVWSNVVIDGCEITKPTQLPGVVSSLVKKGLITQNGSGSDATIQLTAEGYTYFLNNR